MIRRHTCSLALVLTALTACSPSAPSIADPVIPPPIVAPAPPPPTPSAPHEEAHAHGAARHMEFPIRVEHAVVFKDGAAGEVHVDVHRVATWDIPLEVEAIADDPRIVLLDPRPVSLPDQPGTERVTFAFVVSGPLQGDLRLRVSGETSGAGYHWEQPAGLLPATAAPSAPRLTVEVPAIHNGGGTDALRLIEPGHGPRPGTLPKPTFVR